MRDMVVVQCMRMSSPAIRQEQSPAKSQEAFSRTSLVLRSLYKYYLIFSSLDSAAAFVALAEGERPPKKRRVNTTLVVTLLITLGTGMANQGPCQVWCTQRLRVS